MREQIILAPGLNGNELIRNLAAHGVNCFNLKILSAGELSRLALMRSGISITQDFIDSRESLAIVAEAVKGNTYFVNISYSDIRNISLAIRKMRCLVSDPEESKVLNETFSKGIFTDKNAALLEVYNRYMRIVNDRNLIDSVSLIRKAIAESGNMESDFIILNEYPLNPLENALIQTLSDNKAVNKSIKDLYKASDKPLTISSFKNCYGISNEVETIIADIYSGKKIDKCTVAVTDPGTYGQLFFDYALIHDIPMTFGCGIPIINSNPAKLLSLYFHWTNSFFSSDALQKMIFNNSFNNAALKEAIKLEDKNLSMGSLYKYLGDIEFTNNKEINHRKLEAYNKAVEEEAKYVQKGKSKDYDEYCRKVKCIPLLEIMADELALLPEEFVRKYAYIRKDRSKVSTTMLTTLDNVASDAIYDELVAIRNSGAFQTEDDIIKNILSMNVMNQRSNAGHLHITSIDKAMCSVRENLYIAGLSASKYPGAPKENYLLLDSDLKLFGEQAEYMTSENRVTRKIETVRWLAELASDLGSNAYVSYSGLNVAELKRDNASSLIYELYSGMKGTNASYKDLQNEIIPVGYFEPAISASRLIGEAYIDGKPIDHESKVLSTAKCGWKTDEDEYAPTTIETFLSCPRRYMLKNLIGIKEPEECDPFEVISSLDIGILAHSLMEQLANSNMDHDSFIGLSREFFDRFIDEHPPLIPEEVKPIKDNFIEIMENAYKHYPNNEVIFKEEDIHCTHESGIKLHGFPDCVEKLKDGTFLIVDYKSGSTIKHSKDDFASCFQTIVYAYLLEKKGYKVSGCEYRYLRFDDDPITCKYDDEMKEKLTKALELFKKTMKDGDFRCNPLACDFCKYGSICGKLTEIDIWEGLEE